MNNTFNIANPGNGKLPVRQTNIADQLHNMLRKKGAAKPGAAKPPGTTAPPQWTFQPNPGDQPGVRPPAGPQAPNVGVPPLGGPLPSYPPSGVQNLPYNFQSAGGPLPPGAGSASSPPMPLPQGVMSGGIQSLPLQGSASGKPPPPMSALPPGIANGMGSGQQQQPSNPWTAVPSTQPWMNNPAWAQGLPPSFISFLQAQMGGGVSPYGITQPVPASSNASWYYSNY